MLDLFIVLSYFVVIMFFAMKGKKANDMTVDEYFLSDRSLNWYSIAISTIATNVQGYQFIGMMGSAYLFGMAQGILEINAMQGLLLAAFVFVPLYLKDRVTTVSQFLKNRLGEKIALFYTLSNMLIFSTIGLGAALFWGAYAADLIFVDYTIFLHPDKVIRISILIIALGVFSAIYTYFGGLAAVVRTDIIQFGLLVLGGVLLLYYSLDAAGGFQALYDQKEELMHLHLPSDHPKLPWTMMGGLFFLNINYWCANQTVMQRSLAAKNLSHAQAGLMLGGLLKYFMAILIIVPGIALAVILKDQPLTDPDETFPYLVNKFLSPGVKGIIVCALFASLMSTIDSTFNSLATLFSIDIYKPYINPGASARQVVDAGRKTILITLMTGVCMGVLLVYFKFNNPDNAFTHSLNEMRYYINCGIVILICTAVFLVIPTKKYILIAFLSTVPMQFLLKWAIPDMNYFVRAGWVIIIPLLFLIIIAFMTGKITQPKDWLVFANKRMKWVAALMLISLILLHIVFH